MKKGDFINMYNSHSKDGKPDEQTLCGKGILIRPYKSKTKLKSRGWEEYESWTVFVFWDKLGNPPTNQQVWFVHPNDLMEKGNARAFIWYWMHWATETKSACDRILKILDERR